jgi:hypothetical protein
MATLLASGWPSCGQNAKPQATKDALAAAQSKKPAVGAAHERWFKLRFEMGF